MKSQEVVNTPDTIAHAAIRAARLFGAAPAVVSEDQTGISYSDLEESATAVARAFLAHGLEIGERVAIWAPNSADWIIAALGLQMAGGVLVPINTRLKGPEAQYILAASGTRFLITVSGFLGVDYAALIQTGNLPRLEAVLLLTGRSSAPSVAWPEFLAAGNPVSTTAARTRLECLTPDSFCDMLFTSGTTGQPKGALTTHGQNIRQYLAYSAALNLTPNDRYLILNPFFHAFGYKAGWLSALLRGTTIYPAAVFDARNVLRCIERHRITVLPGPPTIFQSLLAERFLDHDLSSLRLSITGSTSVPVELVRRMKDDLGFETVLTAYGLTETCGVVTMSRAEDDIETIANTAGRPIEGLEVRIADDAGAACKPGEQGEILVRGYCVMKGYFENPEETGKAIDSEGWLHTGDIGVSDTHGNIKVTDRKKDMFIVGGFNCYPAEIEHILLSNPDIAQVAVVGVDDERLGEVAKAYVVLRAGATASSQDIIDWSRRNMANYKAPRAVDICDALPMTASGKIEKFKLRHPSPAR